MEPWRSAKVEVLKDQERERERQRAFGPHRAIAGGAGPRHNRRENYNFDPKMEVLRQVLEIRDGVTTYLQLDRLNISDIFVVPEVRSILHLLRSLSCCNNSITDLPNLKILAPNLEYFFCNNNQLESLPELPDTLRHLFCYSNQLRKLPTLPASLRILNCVQNNLIDLPPLPAGLLQLQVNDNQLRELPELPQGLQVLQCHRNNLTHLPRLPDSLDNYHRVSIYDNPFEQPFASYRTLQITTNPVLRQLITLTKDYNDHLVVELLTKLMVDPKSHLSAGTGKNNRAGYGFPVGPNSKVLHLAGLGKNNESFNQTRERLFKQVNTLGSNPLKRVNTNLFTKNNRKRKGRFTRKNKH